MCVLGVGDYVFMMWVCAMGVGECVCMSMFVLEVSDCVYDVCYGGG